MANSTTALQKAMSGGKITDNQAKSALSAAIDKLATAKKSVTKTKTAMVETGGKVLQTAEVQGTLFLASMAEGYMGKDKMEVGGVDLRAVTGLAAIGYGLYDSMSGGKGGGDHALALGNGLAGSYLASAGVDAGRKLAQANGYGPAVTSQPGQPAQPGRFRGEGGAAQLPPAQVTPAATQLAGAQREVLLSPAPNMAGQDDRQGRRSGRRQGRRQDNRDDRQDNRQDRRPRGRGFPG